MKTAFAMCTLLWIGAATQAATAQTTHEVRLEHDAKLNAYRFNPSRITVHRGDVLVFRVAGDGNHSIVFEPGMVPAAQAALGAAMPRRVGPLTSPLLGPKAQYRIVIPALPAGAYRFYCLPHRAYDEVGELVVE